MADIEQATADYVAFFLDITDERVEGFRELAARDIRYRDPLMDERGIDNVVKAMHGWFADLLDIRFEVNSSAVTGQLGMLHWFMHFRIRKLPKRQWVVDGMTRVEFDDDGKVIPNHTTRNSRSRRWRRPTPRRCRLRESQRSSADVFSSRRRATMSIWIC